MFEAIGALAGSVASGLFGRSQQKANLKAQKEFAQHGIRWKVEDAKAAGLHPLAALGAQTHSFAPSIVGDNFASTGQALGRAIESTRTHGERQEAGGRLNELAVERAGLENQILRQQLINSQKATVGQAGGTPATPAMGQAYNGADGQGDAAKLIKQEPFEQPMTNRVGTAPGTIYDLTWSRAPDGKYHPMPSKAVKELMEDNPIPQLAHSLRTYGPHTNIGVPFEAPKGMRWTGNRWSGFYLTPAPGYGNSWRR